MEQKPCVSSKDQNGVYVKSSCFHPHSHDIDIIYDTYIDIDIDIYKLSYLTDAAYASQDNQKKGEVAGDTYTVEKVQISLGPLVPRALLNLCFSADLG